MRIAFIVFFVPGPGDAARATLTDFAVISDPFFRSSIAEAKILRPLRPVLSPSVRDRHQLIRRIAGEKEISGLFWHRTSYRGERKRIVFISAVS
jgi:hypothetical protein